MGSSFQLLIDPRATLGRNCVSQAIVSLSALASIAILLMRVVPIMNMLQ